MKKIGFSLIVAVMCLSASEVNVHNKEHHESHSNMMEKQKKLQLKHERIKRPIEKKHAVKVHNDYTKKIKEIHGETPTGD